MLQFDWLIAVLPFRDRLTGTFLYDLKFQSSEMCCKEFKWKLLASHNAQKDKCAVISMNMFTVIE